MVPNWNIWPSELNQKDFSSFSAWHIIPGETEGSPLSVFSALWDFSFEKILKRSPFHFFDAWRQNGCWNIPKGPHFSFVGLETFSKKISEVSLLQNVDVLQQWMLKIAKGSPFSFFVLVRLFFPKKIHRRVPLSIFLDVLQQWMFKNAKRSPF